MDYQRTLPGEDVSARSLCSRIHGQLRIVVACALVILASAAVPSQAGAQGCVAAHTAEPTLDLLGAGGRPDSGSGSLIRNRLTVSVDYRVYNSWRHYVGDVEQKQREQLHNAIVNHVNLLNLGVNYRLTPRWSLTASIPALLASRHGQAQQGGYYRVYGLGDIQVGAQMWLFRPPTESGGNVAFSFAAKLPTGTTDATGVNPRGIVQTADQSIQPGDDSWGLNLGASAYKRIPWNTMSYFQASYLINPRNKNGVPTFRTRAGEEIMSVPDQYLMRAGVSRHIPKLRNVALSSGMRWEGLPAHDLIGGDSGFRRPGYVVSIEPGLMVNYRRTTLSVLAPWAVRRDRTRSTSDIANDNHGDAAFSDYSVSVSLVHHF